MSERVMKTGIKNFLRQASVLTFGAALVAVGIYFFKIQNHFSTGGVSGLSIVLAAVSFFSSKKD